MLIDGHAVRVESIDAVTALTYDTEGAYEGTDKIIRGQFSIYLKGKTIVIRRSRRITSRENEDRIARDAAVKTVLDPLAAIRENVVKMAALA